MDAGEGLNSVEGRRPYESLPVAKAKFYTFRLFFAAIYSTIYNIVAHSPVITTTTVNY